MKKAIHSLGIVALLLIAIELIRRINQQTSTRLYDPIALQLLQDPDIYREVYGREKVT